MTEAALAQRRANSKRNGDRARAATHCNRNHEFTLKNTYVTPDGRRQCRTCRNDSQWYRRKGVPAPP